MRPEATQAAALIHRIRLAVAHWVYGPLRTPGATMSRQARSLDTLLAEVNAAAPTRSKASDGGLGDQAHASRASDHNPNAAGVWRARDFTDDGEVFDADVFALAVADLLGRHPALGSGAYVIRNRRIISTDRLAEGWRPYSGSNPHDKHTHVSVATAAAGYDSTAPWGVMEDDDTMNPAQEQRLANVEQAVDRIEDTLTTILNVVRKKGANAWERDVDLKALVKEVLAEAKKP